MTAVLDASGLGKQYGRRWALKDCTLSIPAGRAVGLVGPNGAGLGGKPDDAAARCQLPATESSMAWRS